jgi:mannosyltransferase OCH1-like enzyme
MSMAKANVTLSLVDPCPDVGERFSHDQLEAAFRAVQRTDNWKMPQHGVWISASRLLVTKIAVSYFTGSQAEELTRRGDQIQIRFAGYYECIGS